MNWIFFLDDLLIVSKIAPSKQFFISISLVISLVVFLNFWNFALFDLFVLWKWVWLADHFDCWPYRTLFFLKRVGGRGGLQRIWGRNLHCLLRPQFLRLVKFSRLALGTVLYSLKFQPDLASCATPSTTMRMTLRSTLGKKCNQKCIDTGQIFDLLLQKQD